MAEAHVCLFVCLSVVRLTIRCPLLAYTPTHLQAVRAVREHDEALEEGLGEPGLGRLLVDDDRAELAVVAHHHQLLAPHDDGDEALRLHRLRRLVDQDLRVTHTVVVVVVVVLRR